MARRAAHPTSRQPAAASRNRGDPHVQPAAHAPLPFQIHAFAASVLFAHLRLTQLSAHPEVLRMDLGVSDAFSPVRRIIRAQRAIEVLGG
jgi:hypothetical protein